jgi:hypothetical protein
MTLEINKSDKNQVLEIIKKLTEKRVSIFSQLPINIFKIHNHE